MYGKIEEGSVEFLSRELVRSYGMDIGFSAYNDEVTVLEYLNYGLGFYETNLEFAKELFKQPLPERFDWLMEKVNSSIMNRTDLTVDNMQKLVDFVSTLEGGYSG